MSVSFKIDRYVIGKSLSIDINRNEKNNKVPNESQEKPPAQPNPILVPRSPGSIPSNGVELFPSDKTLYESLYGNKK